MEAVSPPHGPDNSDLRPNFNKPASDASRRNYRRHSPSSSRSPTPPSLGGSKIEKSTYQHSPPDQTARDDVRTSKRGADRASHHEYRSSHRDFFNERDDRDCYHNSKRHSSHRDRRYYSGHHSSSSGRSSHYAHAEYHSRDSGRYSRSGKRSPERSKGTDENRQRKRDSREERSNDDKDRYYRRRDRDSGLSVRDNRKGSVEENIRESERLKGNDAVFGDNHKRSHLHNDHTNEDKYASKIDDKKRKDRLEELKSDELQKGSEIASDQGDLLDKSMYEKVFKGVREHATSEAASSFLAPKQILQEQSLGEGGTGGTNDVGNATLAAMRAAEAASKTFSNIVSVTEQKKRLLWGNKTQESPAVRGTNVWDTVQFSDRERQEKFNKLMGVKGEATSEGAKGEEKTSGVFTTEKQQELQKDLEKQFMVGLKRADGRTVGLGL